MASAFADHFAPSPCDQCGNATEGPIRCSVTDSKNLCQGCFHDLPQARPVDIGDPEWVCDIHLNHKVDIFCETCRLGCCKECAVDVHEDHVVVNALKLVEEIRHDLAEQLPEVGVRAERLSELRRKIDSSLGKIEEAPKLGDDIKEEFSQYLEKEVDRIKLESKMRITHEERRRDSMLKLVKEKVDLEIQRIQETQHGLLEDAEKRRCKIQKIESKLLVGQQACESANLEINSLLESTPEKLVCCGRQLSSLVKASSAFQCQNDILDCCIDVEADLPNFNVEKNIWFNGFRLLSPLLKIVVYIFVYFYFSNEATVHFRDTYHRFRSSKWMTGLFMLCSYQAQYHAMLILTLMPLPPCKMYGFPLTRKELFMKKLKSCIKVVQLGLGFWLLAVIFIVLVSSPLHHFQVQFPAAFLVIVLSCLITVCRRYL